MSSAQASPRHRTTLARLQDHQVIQRDRGGTTGSVHLDAALASSVHVHDAQGVVASFPAGSRGPLHIAVGGPYDLVEVGAGSPRTIARDVLVGDLWVLAGQSNMAGYGRLHWLEEPSAHVHVLDMARQWRVAADPLHQLSASPDAIHSGFTDEDRAVLRGADQNPTLGAGLGLAFGRHVHELSRVPIGLIATAHAATSLAQWSPQLAHLEGDSLYGSMLLSIRAGGGQVAGVLWYQGESETDPAAPLTFTEDLTGFVAAVRRDLSTPDLPFFHVQLGRCIEDRSAEHHARYSRIRELQRLFPADGMTTAVDLDLDDLIHVSSTSLRRLGRRLARLVVGQATTISVGDVCVAPDRMSITVEFGGVSGALRGDGHVRGFSVHAPDGHDRAAVVHAGVVAPGSAVVIHLARPALDDDRLAYAYGLDPQVGLVDGGDMGVPAFGPVPLFAPTGGGHQRENVRFTPRRQGGCGCYIF